MNLLINLLPIKKGGGQQVAFNFVTHLHKFEDIKYFVSFKKIFNKDKEAVKNN